MINWALSGKFESVTRDQLSQLDLALLLLDLQMRNARLYLQEVKYKDRKPLLESYAREWRAAHPSLPSGDVPLLEDARGSP